MRIVFTGPAVVDGERVARKFLAEIAQERGHVVQSAVDYYTDVVVASSPDFMQGQGRKLREAHLRGKKVVSPDEFMRMMKSH